VCFRFYPRYFKGWTAAREKKRKRHGLQALSTSFGDIQSRAYYSTPSMSGAARYSPSLFLYIILDFLIWSRQPFRINEKIYIYRVEKKDLVSEPFNRTQKRL